MRRSLLFAIPVLLGASIMGCADDPIGPSSTYGTYDLVSYQGEPLPYTQNDGTVLESGSLRLAEDGTCLLSATTNTEGVSETIDFNGTFVQDGNGLDFSFEELDNFADVTGTVSGSTVTLTLLIEGNEVEVLTFQK